MADCRAHKSLTAACAYLEARGYKIDVEGVL